MRTILSTKEKALRFNLDSSVYGTIAEIGGGQEVARNFFQAGGASGTLAKTISAYDKTFSDHNYESKTSRYVSKDRLKAMLEKEFGELEILLGNKQPQRKHFAFANTVETLNFHKTNKGHGWLGITFQTEPNKKANHIYIHVKLLENDNNLQQYSLGTLGINLIWAAFNYREKPNTFLKSLLDNLDTDRVEIDFIRMKGPDLDFIDNRLLGVQLVKNGMTPAIMFDRNGLVQQPGDLLYKKNVLAFRGSFRPITYVGMDMLRTAFSIFKTDKTYSKENTFCFCEITLNNLQKTGEFNEKDFLQRVDILNGMGQNVMVSSFEEFYKLSDYFSALKINKLRIVVGILTFTKIFDPSYYNKLNGGILEAIGRLFKHNTKLYVYPALDKENNTLLDSTNMDIPSDIKHIYNYLVENRRILDIKNHNKAWIEFFPHDVIEKIKNNDNRWESMVPKFVSKQIKKHELFGYRKELHW